MRSTFTPTGRAAALGRRLGVRVPLALAIAAVAAFASGYSLAFFLRSDVSGTPAAIFDTWFNDASLFIMVSGTAIAVLSIAIALIGGTRSERPPKITHTEHDTAAARYQTYWEESVDGLFVVRISDDDHFYYESINPALERWSGLSAADIKGKTPQQCLSPDDAESVIRRYRNCLSVGRPVKYEHTLAILGNTRQVETNLAPIRNARTGRIDQLVGSCRDVTERAVILNALKQSETRFRALAETIPGMLFTISNEATHRYANPRFYEYTGLPVGSDGRFRSLIHPDDVASVISNRNKSFDSGLPFSVECRLRSANGSYHWFLIDSRRVVIGDFVRWFGIATNIDGLKSTTEEAFRTNRQLNDILSSISDCYLTIDRQWRCTRMNERAEAWFRNQSHSLVGSTFFRELNASNPVFLEAVEDVLARGVSIHLEVPSAAHPGRWVDINVYGSQEGASIFFRDTTERKRAQTSVRQAKELLQSSLDALSARIAILDQNGIVLAVNNSWKRFNTVGNAATGANVGADYINNCETAEIRSGIIDVVRGQQSEFHCTYHLAAGDVPLWYQLRINRFGRDNRARTVVIHEDVSEIIHTRQELIDLGTRLISLQEDERQRIASELRDSTSQHLVAAGLTVTHMRTVVEGVGGADKLCNDLDDLIEESLKEIRTFAYLLHPPSLDSDGFGPTIERFAKRFTHRTGLNVEVEIAKEFDGLPFDLQRSLLRVIQEAFANVFRHASATLITLRMSAGASSLDVEINDDGHGMKGALSDDAKESPFGVGIPGMRSRLRQYDGNLDISTGPRGTKIRASIPNRRIPDSSIAEFAPLQAYQSN